MDQEAHEIVQIGDEGSIELCPTIPSARWEELADFLRKAELPAYHEPDPSPAGDMEVHAVPFVSKIQVTWRDGGEEFTNSYRGHYADELLELLKDIARETNSKRAARTSPPRRGAGLAPADRPGTRGGSVRSAASPSPLKTKLGKCGRFLKWQN